MDKMQDIADVIRRLPSDMRRACWNERGLKPVREKDHKAYNTDHGAGGDGAHQIVSINLPRAWITWLDNNPTYTSRSEAVRMAVREFIIRQANLDAFLEGEQ